MTKVSLRLRFGALRRRAPNGPWKKPFGLLRARTFRWSVFATATPTMTSANAHKLPQSQTNCGNRASAGGGIRT